MSNYTLRARIRTITGKKVKALRASGDIPATVYGKNTKPLTVAVKQAEFQNTFAQAGETGLIELAVDGKKYPVLIHGVQTHPVGHAILHVEFHQVDLKEKVRADVPLEFVGLPQAVKEKVGLLLTLLDHVTVEALPTDLPENIPVDISSMATIDEQIIVGELAIPDCVTLLTDPTLIVAKIGPFVVEKEPEPVPAAEGEVPAEGEAVPTEQGEGADKVEKTPTAISPEEPPQEKKL